MHGMYSTKLMIPVQQHFWAGTFLFFKLPLLMNTFHQVTKSDKFSLYKHLP